MFKRKSLLFIFLILILSLQACAQATPTVAPVEAEQPAAEQPAAEQPEAEQPAAEAPTSEKPFFGFVMHNFESEFTVEIKVGAEAACEDLSVDCEVTGPAKFDPPTAIQMFEGLLAKNPSGIALVPNPQDPWTPILNQYADEAKIISVANGDAPGTPRQFYVGADEVGFGRALAQAVIDAGVTEGKVIVGSCYPPALPLQQRDEGLREVFADYPDIQVLDTFDSTAEQTTNYAFWENIVTAHPDIKAGIGLCTFEGPTFADLMPKLDFDFVAVTADLIPETLEAIRAGSVDAAIGQHPFLQGYLPMYFMARYTTEGTPMPSGHVKLPAEIVTAENLDTVVERQTDPAKAYEWYKAFIKENLAEIEASVAPFEDQAAVPAEEAEEDPAAASGPAPFFGFVMHNFESEFTVEIKVGAEAACQDLSVDCEVTGPAKFDPPTAIQMFEGLLAKNPSGIALVPNPQDPWTPILNQYADEAKIISVANGDAPGTPRQFYVGADEVGFGRALAQAVIDAGVTEGKVIVGSCYPPALPLQQRDEGLREVFADYPDIQVLDTFDSTAEQTTNYAFWENIVTAHPDIKAGIGLCTFEGPTFADLMPKLDFDFVAVTADLIPETLEAIRAGSVDAAIGQHPFLQGYLPMYFMARYTTEGTPMPSGHVKLPAEIVTAENLDTVVERQTDPAKAYEWYKTFIEENLADIEANVVPFTE